MKKLSIVFLLALIFSIMSSPVFALSFKFDFYGGDTNYPQGDFEDPQEIDLHLSETVMVDIWLVDWPEARPNMKAVQYHFMWHKDSLDVVSIACNNPDWQLPAEMLVEDGDYVLGMTILFGGGVAGPDTLLHTIELQCEAAPSDDWIKATLGSNGFVRDMNDVSYYDVVDGDGIIHQVVDIPTVFPVVDTECPEIATECPELPTWCPDNEPTVCQVTECPDNETFCPVEPTVCPVVETECPVVETKCPIYGDTYCPLEETSCPKVETFCPFEETLCPAFDPTFCPYLDTECFQSFTWCPIDTFCPDAPTFCYPFPTICEDVTSCPDDPTFCPLGMILPTVCPMEFTFCPDIPTSCFPEIPTECPEFETVCPGDWTFCPFNDTYCPEDPTYCPLIDTFCGAETECPAIFTQCPTDPTNCPGGPTWCPEILTQCPVLYTFCPDADPTICEITQCPVTDTLCPVDPTNCPLVDTDNDGADDCNDNCLNTPNGPLLGSCVKATSGVVVGIMGTTCNIDADCATGETCDKVQGDINGNGCGDACECYADITGPGGVPDGKVDLTDLVLMKVEFLQPCPPSPCSADLNGDNKVDLADLVIMKMQFLKTGCPC